MSTTTPSEERAEHWKHDPDPQDFPAAAQYLSLLVRPRAASRLEAALRARERLDYYKAKDILRASGLPLLPADDAEAAKDLAKVAAGTRLSPVLLVRGIPLWVADGYHRICASYHLSENAAIPCRIVRRDR